MAEVHWSEGARRNLRAAIDYGGELPPVYAAALAARLPHATDLLRDQPRMRRRVPEFDEDTIRELIVGNHRVVYGVYDDSVRILAVVHGSRRFAADLDNGLDNQKTDCRQLKADCQ